MYYLISLFSVLILLSMIIIGNRINNRLLQISKSIDGTNERTRRAFDFRHRVQPFPQGFNVRYVRHLLIPDIDNIARHSDHHVTLLIT